jgi:hypothetical protein
LAKCYAALCLSGQQGQLVIVISVILMKVTVHSSVWHLCQVLSTDEAIMGSQTNGLRQMATNTWDSNTAILNGYYARLYQIIGYTNEFLRQTTDAKLQERGHTDLVSSNRLLISGQARFSGLILIGFYWTLW